MSERRQLSVFLCHASQDKPIVRELYQRLKQEGWVDPWLDEEKLSPGQAWTSTIEEAIDSADNVIIFLSEHSVSKEGFVQRELKRAWKRSTEKPENVIFLIPFRLDDCEVPRRLRSRQWGDYFGEKKENTYESLLISLKQRYQQKLQLEAKERARVEELLRNQEEDRVRREKEEFLRKEAEEQARREREEKARLEDLARKETIDKLKTIVEENQAQRIQAEQARPLTFSKYTGSSILIDSSIVHFESLGRGRPVIFLHGWVGSWRYWFSSMQVVSRSFRSYTLDFWGFGDTAHNTLNYSLEGQSSLLEHFLTEMGIGKIAIIGHGLGALVGMTFATRFPQSVDRLMAVSCPLDYRAVNPRLRTALPFELTEWLSNRTPEATTALSDAPKADMQAIVTSLAGLEANNVYANFRVLNIPCLLVYGDRDPAITILDGEYSLTTMTHQIELEGSGHFPMIDETNKFNRLLMDFLALNPGMSPRELQMKEEWRRRGNDQLRP